jgi:hypothetical protein
LGVTNNYRKYRGLRGNPALATRGFLAPPVEDAPEMVNLGMIILEFLWFDKRLHNYGKIHHVSWEQSTISMANFNSYIC